MASHADRPPESRGPSRVLRTWMAPLLPLRSAPEPWEVRSIWALRTDALPGKLREVVPSLGESNAQPGVDADGLMRQAILRDVVRLHKEFMGRGPINSKVYMHDDSVLVLMLNGHTPSEQTMLDGGGRRSVAQTRVDLSESVRQRFINVVEGHTGRKVVGFMSSSQQEPDMLSHVYVLKPTDLLTVASDDRSSE
jgi:uncharacterized protein YbcI